MIVTLTTDFGHGEYVAAMKGVILSIDETARIVDISHSIARGNIRETAFVLYAAVPYFPPAVHVAVVDPGVGTKRRALAISTETAILVGPDNGILIPVAKKLGIKAVHEISNKKLCRPGISATFHGRDVFASVAAHLARGVKVDEVGPSVREWIDLDFGRWRASDRQLNGIVIFVDRFGNAITNIPGDALISRAEFGERVTIGVGGRQIRAKLRRSYGFAKKGESLLTVSSSGFVEIAVNGESAKERLRAEEDAPVSVRIGPASKDISN